MLISKNSLTIGQLFELQPLYVVDEKYYTKALSSDPCQMTLQGKNKKKTLVIYQCNEGHELPSNQYQPLTKLLKAVGLEIDDIYLINADDLPQKAFCYLLHHFSFEACVFLGPTAREVGLTVKAPRNRFFRIENKLLFFTHPLKELIANANNEKREMWLHFKQLPKMMANGTTNV
jgi:hypothetical protein